MRMMVDDNEELYGGYKLESFPKGDPSPVVRLVTEKTSESHALSYKAVDFLDKGKTVQLCREFCSFFNSAGGVIIVGVEEESDHQSERYKQPTQIRGITQELSTQWLQDVLVNGIVPPAPLEKIVVHKFPDPNNNRHHGYVIFVPRSYTAPHQVVKDGKYYKRGIEGRVFMLHWEIMDMLGRGQRPQLTIEPYDYQVFTKGAAPNTDYIGRMTLWFTVGNCGKAPARNISVRIHGVGQPLPDFRREVARWRYVTGGSRGEWYFAWEPDFPLLPKAEEWLSIGYRANVPETERDVNSQMPFPVVRRQVNIVGEAYAEGQDPMPFGLYLRVQWHMGEYVADDKTTERGIIPADRLSGLQTGVIPKWEFFDEVPPSGTD